MFENRKYVIFNMSEISLIDFNEVMETSADTLRLSVDGSKSFVKWEGAEMPACIQQLTTKEGPYNHQEITVILGDLAWTPLED